MKPERTPDRWPCGAVENGWCDKPKCWTGGCEERDWPAPPLKVVEAPEPEDRPNIDIEDRLISAFIVWATCSKPGPRGVKSNMPEHLKVFFDEWNRTAVALPRHTPSPHEITLAEEALNWFGIFMKGDNSREQRDKTTLITEVIIDKIYRGGRMDWPVIRARMKWYAVSPNTIRQRYNRAIDEMEKKLDLCAGCA